MPYQSNFLTLVILRLDYSPLSVLGEKPSAFTTELKNHLPVVRGQQRASIVLTAGNSVAPSFEQQQKGWQWSHSDVDDLRVVSLTTDYFALEYKGIGTYVNYAEFRQFFAPIYNKFKAAFGISEYRRIGLRYVNEVSIAEGDALDWDNLISPDLVTGVKPAFATPLRMTRSMHQVTGIKDDISCIVNYGLHNPDYPNPITRRQFVLDLDSYVEAGVAEGEALKKIDTLYSLGKEMFETSIGDGLRQRMVKQ